jgi:hypothetical protein
MSTPHSSDARAWTRIRRYLLLWPGRRRRLWVVTTLPGIGAALLVVLVLFAVASWISPTEGGILSVDASCDENDFACSTLTELLGTALAVTVAAALFLYWRVFRVAREHVRNGLETPAELVPTATPMGTVVGRDAVCEIIEADLRDKKGRRPQLIVGGVGEGKTAVLVRLTQLLIERCAVPVPIRLRDAEIPLDFLALAKDQFMDRVQRVLLSDDEGDKVWRKLCNDHRVVVLADGLEEALHDRREARHGEIRRALKKALAERTPLVITSRPDEVLRGLDAAVIRLEPLSETDAAEYIADAPDSPADLDREDLERLVKGAQVTESPLYLQLAHKLHCRGQLAAIPSDEGRLATRVELLERWRQCLLAGAEGARMHWESDRKTALEILESLACHALRKNTLEVPLPKAVPDDRVKSDLAVSVGEDLELVDRVPDGVRFRHSVMQAYLGGRAIPAHAREPLGYRVGRRVLPRRVGSSYLDAALEDPKPSRELLMGLTVASFRTKGTDLPVRFEDRLRAAALRGSGHFAFDLLATAYEVDRLTSRGATRALGSAAKKLWLRPSETPDPIGDPRVNEAKMRAIARMEDAGGRATYRALWKICEAEDVYQVRLRAAQTLAEGGAGAHAVLEQPIEKALGVGERLAGRSGSPPAPGDVRLCSLMGWILPTLAASCGRNAPARVRHITSALEAWVDLSQRRLHLGIESCIAQGFKHEANRLPNRTPDTTRRRLIELAQDLLDTTRWWYSQLSLLQALTLCSLGADPNRRSAIRERVAGWEVGDRHPLVKEAARLCVLAIDEAYGRDGANVRASRYLWIDEAGVVAKIGAGTVLPDPESTAGLWVSQAAGWKTLDEAAQWLVGDVFVFLNLIEGGEAPPRGTPDPTGWSASRAAWREQRRQNVRRQGARLPPCLTAPEGHALLRPEREEGAQQAEADRKPCGCPFDLCPYPAPHERPFRGEPPETFCRGQKRLAHEEGAPAWYESGRQLPGMTSAKDDLSKFWERMEARAQRISALLLASREGGSA